MAIAGFQKIGVVGAGQMGRGIAQVCATFGLEVVLFDSYPNACEAAQANIEKSVSKLHQKGKIEVEPSEVLGRIQTTDKIDLLADRDLIIEAIIEDEAAKTAIFTELDKICKSDTAFASNTSSISITRLASKTQRSTSFIGMHFMNPVPIMQLVEIIPGMATSPELTERITKLAEGLGKQVSTSQDYPGFVVNRILMPMINEAFTALMEGVASAEDIDKGMKLGTNQPMGPLALADFIGLDTCLAIMKVLHQGLGDSKYRPSPLLVKYVEAGYFGKKTGRGVYQY